MNVKILLTAAALVVGTPVVARAQGGPVTPIAVDIQKVPIGSWAEYAVTIDKMKGKARWALVGRDKDGVSFEMSMEGGPTAPMGGQKMVSKMVLAADPTATERPVKKLIVQMGDMDPFELPAEAPQVQGQRFEKPDPKKLVGKETIKVPAGKFATSHYRDKRDQGTVDFWVSDTLPPLGMVKMTVTPKDEKSQAPKVTLELSGKGGDAKPTITKAAKPFNPAMMGGPGGPGHGGPRPGAAPPAPAPAPAPAKK